MREHLGTDGSSALADMVEAYGEAWKKDVMTACMDRLDARLQTLVSRDEFVRGVTELRLEMKEDRLALSKDMAGLRADLIRWSFLFWIGQVAATAGLISLALGLAR